MAEITVTAYGINTYTKRIDIEVTHIDRYKAEKIAVKACRKAEKELLAEGFEWGSVQISPQGRSMWLFTHTYHKDTV